MNHTVSKNSLIRAIVDRTTWFKSPLIKESSISLLYECSPDSWVLSVADGRELLSEEWVHLGVDGNQLAQSLSSPQPHPTARVLQGLQEGGLQLGQEGLQGNAHLEKEYSPEVRTKHCDLLTDDLIICGEKWWCFWPFIFNMGRCRYRPLPAAGWESPAERSSPSRQSGLPRYEWAVQWCWRQRAAVPQARSVWWLLLML